VTGRQFLGTAARALRLTPRDRAGAAAESQTGTAGLGQLDETASGQAGPPGPAAVGPASKPRRRHKLRRTRSRGFWAALAASAVVLLLLLIFILENESRADIGFFGTHVSLPVGVAMLLSAVAGALVVIIPSTARILQLRLAARRQRRDDFWADTTDPWLSEEETRPEAQQRPEPQRAEAKRSQPPPETHSLLSQPLAPLPQAPTAQKRRATPDL
jgi:uncharacterized integral membrane protein